MARQRLIALLIVLAVAVFFIPASVGQTVKGYGQLIVGPVTKPLTSAYTQLVSFLQATSSLHSIVAELNDLKEENLKLKAALGQLEEVKRENETLRKEAGARGASKHTGLVAAQVVGRSPVKFVPEITIDRGSKDGIAVNQPVLVAGHLVGTIVNTTEITATLRLISAHNSVVPVVLSSSRGVGLLKGGLRGLIVDDLPADTQINVGEPVVTEQIGPFEHAGIAVGTVEKVISSKSEIFQVVSVISPIDFTTIRFVSVLIQ